MAVGGDQHTVDVELEELFVVTADGGRNGSCDYGRPQRCGRRDGLGSARDEERVVDVLGRDGVERVARISSEIGAFGRTAQDVRPQPALGDDGTEGMDPWPSVGSDGGEVPKGPPVLVQQGSACGRQNCSARHDRRYRCTHPGRYASLATSRSTSSAAAVEASGSP
jgi:hypothetical protein